MNLSWGGVGTPNKSPDARVGISLVPFHYAYQRAFLQPSERPQPISARFHADHTKAAAAASEQSRAEQYCNNRRPCEPALLNCYQLCKLWSYRSHTGLHSRPITAILCHSSSLSSLSLSLLLSPPVRLFYNSPSRWINPRRGANLWAGVTLCSL